MEQCYAVINGRRYEFDLYPPIFDVYWERNTKGRRCLILTWRRETQFANIIQLTMVIFHLGPPWFHHSCSILDKDEPVQDEEEKKNA